ncbi:MAG: hypothetical protein GY805_11255 [Chloroflexi bacterium]|nr:hypothetical protein [Chloroflexota bacterium]
MTKHGRNRLTTILILLLFGLSYLLPNSSEDERAPFVGAASKVSARDGNGGISSLSASVSETSPHFPVTPSNVDLPVLAADNAHLALASLAAQAPTLTADNGNGVGHYNNNAVSIGSINVRQGPGMQHGITTVFPGGTSLMLLGQYADWFLIGHEGAQVGWALRGAVTVIPSFDVATLPEIIPPELPSDHDTTTHTTSNVYTGPGAHYPVAAGNIPADTIVRVIGRTDAGDWVQIADDYGIAGWLSVATLTFRSGFDLDSVPVVPVPSPLQSVMSEGFEWGGQTHDFVYADKMYGMGMGWVKVQYKWRPDSRSVDVLDLIQQAHAAGLKILLALPGQAYPSESIDYAAYVLFLSGVAALDPTPNAIEVWNEMNIDAEWPVGEIDPATYVTQMLAPAYTAIKSVNPNIMVISGAPAPTGFDNGSNAWADARYIKGMAQAGAVNYLDCVGIHYNAGATPPSATTGHPAGGFYGWYFLPSLSMYYETFDRQRPLCITEMGYLTADGWRGKELPKNFWWASETSLDEQGEWLAQAIQLAREGSFVRMLMIFNVNIHHWDGDPQGGYALIRPFGDCPACAWLTGERPVTVAATTTVAPAAATTEE